MKDTRQRDILNQLLKVDTYSLRSHANAFGSIADTEHGYSLTSNETSFPQVLKGVTATVVFGNHPQAGWATIHRVKLQVVRKISLHFQLLSFKYPELHYDNATSH